MPFSFRDFPEGYTSAVKWLSGLSFVGFLLIDLVAAHLGTGYLRVLRSSKLVARPPQNSGGRQGYR